MIIFLYYLVILFHLSCASVLDRDSFIIVAEASSLVQRGRNLLANGSWNEGISYLRDSLLLFPPIKQTAQILFWQIHILLLFINSFKFLPVLFPILIQVSYYSTVYYVFSPVYIQNMRDYSHKEANSHY